MTLRMNMNNVNQFKDFEKNLSERTSFFSDPPNDFIRSVLKNPKYYNKIVDFKNYFQQFIDNPSASAADQIDANSYMKKINPILTRFEAYRSENPTEFAGGKRQRRTKKRAKRVNVSRRGHKKRWGTRKYIKHNKK